MFVEDKGTISENVPKYETTLNFFLKDFSLSKNIPAISLAVWLPRYHTKIYVCSENGYTFRENLSSAKNLYMF